MIELLNRKIKELRYENSLTQEQLAEILGIAKNTLCQYEKNKANPSLEIVLKIADYFGVSVDYLLGREDDFGNITIRSEGEKLTPREEELMEILRSMPESLQDIALDTVRALAGASERNSYTNYKKA